MRGGGRKEGKKDIPAPSQDSPDGIGISYICIYIYQFSFICSLIHSFIPFTYTVLCSLLVS